MPRHPVYSAVGVLHDLVAWHQTHQRWPAAMECRAANGLPHWTTLYRMFPDYPTILDHASALMTTASSVFAQTTKPCMRCGAPYPYRREVPVRHCDACRKWLHRHDEDDEPASLGTITRWH